MVDNTVVSPAPVLGTPEYDAAMAAKYDAANTPPAPEGQKAPAVATRPDSIPEKFWDAEKGEVRTEALLKSYSELEKARNTKAAPDAPKDPVAPVNAPAAEAVVAAAGFDYDVLVSEFAEHGDITPETRAALEAKGISNATIDSHIAGQHALAREWDNEGYTVAGGKESFDKMATWAAAALTRQEAVAFNNAFNDTNVDAMKMAVSALKTKYEAANGKAPGLLGGSPSNAGQGYESRAQMVADMKKPEYAKDPAFRASVERKLAVTSTF